MPSRLNPYIAFDGDARQAMEFYKGIFGGTLTVNTFGDFGQKEAGADKIMHSMLETDSGFTLMAADSPPGMEYKYGNNISVSLSGDNADELRGYWDEAVQRRHGIGPPGEADVGRRLRHVHGPLRHHLAGQHQRAAGLNGSDAPASPEAAGASLAPADRSCRRELNNPAHPAMTVVTTLWTAPASGGVPFRSANSMCTAPISVGASVSTSASAAMRPSSRSAVR